MPKGKVNVAETGEWSEWSGEDPKVLSEETTPHPHWPLGGGNREGV